MSGSAKKLLIRKNAFRRGVVKGKKPISKTGI